MHFRMVFIGILLSTILFSLSRYLFRKDKASLWFSFYIMALLIYFLFPFSDYSGLSFLKFNYEPLNKSFRYNQINLAFILYFYFASSFLDGKGRYPTINKSFITVTKINIIIWVLGTILMFSNPDSVLVPISQYTVFTLILIMAIIGVLVIYRHWSYLERFFIAGTMALIFSGLYSLFLPLRNMLLPNDLHPPVNSGEVFMVCVLIQLFTYIIAIGYKTKREKIKAMSLEKFWIRELEINKSLQDDIQATMLRYQEQLEHEVKERSDEIINRNSELHQANMKQALEEYNRRAVESELKALRTQINPHFLFNSMNILTSFVIRDLKEEALDFILKFSQLMRLVLENSRHHEIPIERDIATLKLYVQLEAIRYDFSFDYQFEIAPELSKNYLIPPMLLQPYVENAIRHGLGNKQMGKRLLTIKLYLEQEHLICEISDNGVGRKKAALLKTESLETQHHESLGMKVTESRINLLQELSHGKASVDIIDLEGKEKGTLIRLRLPAIKDDLPVF